MLFHNRRAVTIGLLYLLMIPGYAGIYCAFPEEFHHTTSHLGQSYQNDINRLMVQLKADFNRGIEAIERMTGVSPSTKLQLSESEWIKGKRVYQFDLLTISDDGLEFEVNLRPSQDMQKGTSGFYQFWTIAGIFSIDKSIWSNASGWLDLTARSTLSGSTEDVALWPVTARGFDSNYSTKYGVPPPDDEYLYLGRLFFKDQFVVSVDTDKTARILLAAHKGQPRRLSAMFLRMLYLSSVTMTTLGCGDIVPISSRSRILVASQSVFGIVLMGLFLLTLGNGVARRIAVNSVSTSGKH